MPPSPALPPCPNPHSSQKAPEVIIVTEKKVLKQVRQRWCKFSMSTLQMCPGNQKWDGTAGLGEGVRREKTLDSSARMHFMYKDLASHFYGACPTVPLGAVTVNYLIYCGKTLNLPHFHRPGFQTLGFYLLVGLDKCQL